MIGISVIITLVLEIDFIKSEATVCFPGDY